MSGGIYWGEGGQFGPFDVQKDGWPNAGQVMRYFREKLGISAKALGKLYGKEIKEDGKPISERWILEMELENKVPVDITRRHIIARLLSIPPALLGLAALEDIAIKLQNERSVLPVVTSEGTLKKVYVDLARYEKNVRTALILHQTSNAQSLLEDVNADKRELEQLETQVRGDLVYRVRELLISNNLLAAKVERDRRRYNLAHAYADQAVTVAKSMQDDDLIATAKYTRGCINLQWGQFGEMEQGRFQLDKSKIERAIRDFRAVLHGDTLPEVSMHPQLKGFTLLQMSRARSLLENGNYALESTDTLMLVNHVADLVEREAVDDLYTRMLVTGTLSGLHLGGYHLLKADIFNAAGLPESAIIELSQFNKLIERTYGQDETRNQAWSDIVLTKALVGLKEYNEATKRAKIALIKCHTIHSIQNVAIIADIYSRLASSSHRLSKDVEELRNMLEGWYRLTHL